MYMVKSIVNLCVHFYLVSPRMSLSSMANENDLYNVPKKDGAAIEESDAGEGIYNVPRLTTSLERPRPVIAIMCHFLFLLTCVI